DEVILDGYFQEDPTPQPKADAPPGFEHMMAYLDEHSFRPKLHRWRFNLKDGTTREERLSDRILEFGMINSRFGGRKYRYAYS
ncbi:carotenoid oxygenase family protein, partial [Acinetobacter baumannii]